MYTSTVGIASFVCGVTSSLLFTSVGLAPKYVTWPAFAKVAPEIDDDAKMQIQDNLYIGGTQIQAPLAAIGSLSSAIASYYLQEWILLVPAALMLSNLPITYILIAPTNSLVHKAAIGQGDASQANNLIRKWIKLHNLRVLAAAAASVVSLYFSRRLVPQVETTIPLMIATVSATLSAGVALGPRFMTWFPMSQIKKPISNTTRTQMVKNVIRRTAKPLIPLTITSVVALAYAAYVTTSPSQRAAFIAADVLFNVIARGYGRFSGSTPVLKKGNEVAGTKEAEEFDSVTFLNVSKKILALQGELSGALAVVGITYLAGFDPLKRFF